MNVAHATVHDVCSTANLLCGRREDTAAQTKTDTAAPTKLSLSRSHDS